MNAVVRTLVMAMEYVVLVILVRVTLDGMGVHLIAHSVSYCNCM